MPKSHRLAQIIFSVTNICLSLLKAFVVCDSYFVGWLV